MRKRGGFRSPVREYRTPGSLAGLAGNCQSYATYAIRIGATCPSKLGQVFLKMGIQEITKRAAGKKRKCGKDKSAPEKENEERKSDGITGMQIREEWGPLPHKMKERDYELQKQVKTRTGKRRQGDKKNRPLSRRCWGIGVGFAGPNPPSPPNFKMCLA